MTSSFIPGLRKLTGKYIDFIYLIPATMKFKKNYFEGLNYSTKKLILHLFQKYQMMETLHSLTLMRTSKWKLLKNVNMKKNFAISKNEDVLSQNLINDPKLQYEFYDEIH